MSTPINPFPKKLKPLVNESRTVRDVFNGHTSVMNKKYVPQWNGEDEIDYAKRIKGTMFINFIFPIVDSLAGLVTRKPPTVIGDGTVDVSNLDGRGISLHSYSKALVKNSLVDGLSFIRLISTDTDIFFDSFRYSDLISYTMEENKITQMVFQETIEEVVGKFETREVIRYLVYTPTGGSIWYAKDGEEITQHDEWTNTLGYIPIFPVISGRLEKDLLVKSRLFDVALLNLNHVNMKTNLSHILNIISNPIPVFYDFKENEKIKLNVTNGIRFDDRQTGGFEYVEVTGAGVGHLREEIKSLEQQINETTFSVLKRDASQTVSDALSKDESNSSIIGEMALSLEDAINRAYTAYYELKNQAKPIDFKIEYKKEFSSEEISIDIAMKLLLSGEMSSETFYYVLKTGELPRDLDLSKEKEKVEIE